MKHALHVAAAAAALLAASAAGARTGVAGTKHDFSVSGPGAIHALDERNACVFCHVPHSGSSNRPDLVAVHTPYESGTLQARPGAPTGATRVCLSCHDGTIAVGETRSGRIATVGGAIPAGSSANLGTDLRRTHPVSFQPVPGSGTHPPPANGGARLDRAGQVQCTSCHDPHEERRDPVIGKFLLEPVARSGLCLSCHDAAAVEPAGSSHATAATTPPLGDAAGARFATVGEAGCLACHVTHGADTGGQLVKRPGGDVDGLCLRCHDGSATRVAIGRELAKPYAHARGASGVHDAGEGRPGSRVALPETSPGAPRHVSCVDCHDPHAASDVPAVAGSVSGALTGVWGIDASGARVEQVRFEHELCFKCHGDSANKPQSEGPRPPSTVRRQALDANLREVFGASAASAHPVLAAVRGGDVPSLKAPLAPGATITCGDCHGSETGPGAGGSGPRGPHGSIHPHLLARGYQTAPGPESPSAYALCYKCHDREVLLSDASAFPLHALHASRGASCATCHDAHGVSARTGTPSANAHLLNFDVSVAAPLSGVLAYQRSGARAGSCTLSCHGEDHQEASYGVVGPSLRLGPAQRKSFRSTQRR